MVTYLNSVSQGWRWTEVRLDLLNLAGRGLTCGVLLLLVLDGDPHVSSRTPGFPFTVAGR